MDFHPGINFRHRCGAHIQQSRGGRSHQHDLVLELRSFDAIMQHIRNGNVTEAALLAAVWHEGAHIGIYRNFQPATGRIQFQPFQAAIPLGLAFGKTGQQFRFPEQGAHHGE